MDVKPISNNNSFTGYVGPNLKKYINGTIQNEVDQLVRNANSDSKYVDSKKISDLKLFGNTILNYFSKYVAKTNKKTKLDLNETGSDYMRLYFENPITSKEIKVFNSCVYDKAEIYGEDIAIPSGVELNPLSKSKETDLHKLVGYIKSLSEINPKQIDKIFLDNAEFTFKAKSERATGFFEKIKARKMAKQIEEFAKEMGSESTALTRLEKYFKIAKERKIEAIEQKKIEKENKKIAEKILNS